MKGSATAIALVVSAAVMSVSDARSCVAYQDAIPGSASLGFCAGIVNYPYYVENDQTTQAQLELLALNAVLGPKPALMETFLSLLPPSCTAQLKKVACTTKFPRCDTVDPFFLNTCTCTAAGICEGGTETCSPGPSLQAGAAGVAWTQTTCTNAGYMWTAATSTCSAALPRQPCRSQCEAIQTADKTLIEYGFDLFELEKAKCPLISGHIWTMLVGMLSAPTTDDATKAEVLAIVSAKNCNPAVVGADPADPEVQRCAKQERFTGNVLAMFGAAPTCEGTKTVYSMTFEEFPQTVQASLRDRVEANIVNILQLGNAGCGPNGSNSVSCNTVRRSYDCAGETDSGAATVQSSVAVAEKDSVCYNILKDPTNRDEKLTVALLGRDAAALGDPSKAAACFLSGKYDAAYFVPPWPGLPPLAARLDPSGREGSPPENAACPVDTDGGTRYTNVPSSTPLCTSAITGAQGYNGRQCLDIRVAEANVRFPPFAPFKCRAAFLEMLCAQGMMKLEYKELCLVPGGDCEGINLKSALKDDKVPLQFAVPRFPSNKMCLKFKSECADLIAAEPALDIDCSSPVGPTKCTSEELEGGVWPCESRFSAFPQYPEATQAFVSDPLAVLPELGAYGTEFEIDFTNTFASNVVKPTLSAKLYEDESGLTKEDLEDLQAEYCKCPQPLVVPDNVFGDTLGPQICCDIPCYGTMYTQDDMDRFGVLQLALSTIGVLCSLFMVATWGFFEEKSKQYMTYWFSVCSLNASLCTWIVAISTGGKITDALCEDNSTPHSVGVTGFSLCVFQSLWLLFFASAECAWWFVQAVDLFRKIVLGARSTDGSKRWYHLFCWLVPTIAVTGVLARERSGFKPPTPFCFFSPDTPSYAEWLIFYTFVAVTFIFGTLLMMSVLAVIVRHASNVAKQGSSAGAKFRTKYKMYRTPVLFVSLFVFVWIVIFSFRLFVSVNEDTYRSEAQAWITCLLSNFVKGISDPANDPAADISMLINAEPGQTGCGMTQPGGIPNNSVLLMFCVVMGQSIVVFLIFGLKAENFSLWCRAIGCEEPLKSPDAFESPDDFTKNTMTSEYESGSGRSPRNAFPYGVPQSPSPMTEQRLPPQPPGRVQLFPYQQGSARDQYSNPYESSRFESSRSPYDYGGSQRQPDNRDTYGGSSYRYQYKDIDLDDL